MSNKDFFTACAIPWFKEQTDNIEQQINNQLQYQLNNLAVVVWRTEGVENGLVRWEDRHPDVIFKDGFVPRANPPKGQLRTGIADLYRYVVYHDFAIFVSTARTHRVGTTVQRWAPNNQTNVFEYTVYAYGGINVNATLGDHPFVHQDEIAFPGGIKPEFIYCARQYDANGTVIRVWINMNFNLMANGPRYQVPLYRLPDVLNWSTGVQITNWISPGKYEYYHKLGTDPARAIIQDTTQALSAETPTSATASFISEQPEAMWQPGSVQVDTLLSQGAHPSTDEAAGTTLAPKDSEPMWGPGKEVSDPFLSRTPIRASLPLALYGRPKEAWFFTDDKCARFTIDGTDKLVAGPVSITAQWPSLKALGFLTVDAFLPIKGGAFVFSKEKYGRIAIDNQLKDTKVSGPSLITDGWKSLSDYGLRRVDAVLLNPTKPGEAWVFHGRLYIQIKFTETSNSFVAGPFVIAEKWASLSASGFDTVDTLFATSNASEAWFYKGTRNVLVDVTKDKSKKDVNYVSHNWQSLVQAKFY
ncbi:hypothetical protein DXG01_002459 [Tephrocybe rancida]|nr:hypothetical protein DXG01_002459 [Tephrocybe rancida]